MKKGAKVFCRVLGIFFFVMSLLMFIISETWLGILSLFAGVLYTFVMPNKPPRKKKREAVKESSPAPSAPEPKIKPYGAAPSRIGGALLAYQYRFPILSEPGIDIVKDILIDQEKEAALSLRDGCILLSVEGQPVGTIKDPAKAQMLSDWERKERPARAVLLADGQTAALYFYRDDQKENAWREQSAFALTSYKSDEKQEWIRFLSPGDPLELEEDDEKEGVVHVLSDGEAIGNLPARYAKKYLEEDAFGCYVEEIEIDDDGNDKPVVRVYW